jgi:DnaK suppressor protein
MPNEDLDKDQIAALQERLLQLQTELEEQLTLGKAATGVVKLDQTSVGRLSRMDAMQQQNMAVSTQKKAAVRLGKVQAALLAIVEHDYGYCRRCDELIAYRRLLAQPEAKLCLLCQDLIDRQQ